MLLVFRHLFRPHNGLWIVGLLVKYLLGTWDWVITESIRKNTKQLNQLNLDLPIFSDRLPTTNLDLWEKTLTSSSVPIVVDVPYGLVWPLHQQLLPKPHSLSVREFSRNSRRYTHFNAKRSGKTPTRRNNTVIAAIKARLYLNACGNYKYYAQKSRCSYFARPSVTAAFARLHQSRSRHHNFLIANE